MNVDNIKKAEAIPALTGLRFIAAFSIVLHHLTLTIYKFDNYNLFNEVLNKLGSFGMSLFFVLSGFVIHYNYHQKLHTLNPKKIYNFLVARFARLYPLFLTFLTIDLMYQIIIFKVNINNVQIPLFRWLTLSHSWWYSLVGAKTITYSYCFSNITWSISVEVLLYFSYPLFIKILNKIKSNRGRLFSIIGFLLFSFCYYGTITQSKDTIMKFAISCYGQNALEINSPYDFWTWITFLSPIIRFPEFILGVLGAHLILGIRNTKITKMERVISFLFLAISLLGILSQFSIFNGLNVFFMDHLFYYRYTYSVVVIILYCSRYEDVIIKFLSIKSLLKLGDISYSIYLFHTVIFYFFKNNETVHYDIQNMSIFCLKFIIASFIVLSISLVSYKLIEVPFKTIIIRKLFISPL